MGDVSLDFFVVHLSFQVEGFGEMIIATSRGDRRGGSDVVGTGETENHDEGKYESEGEELRVRG